MAFPLSVGLQQLEAAQELLGGPGQSPSAIGADDPSPVVCESVRRILSVLSACRLLSPLPAMPNLFFTRLQDLLCMSSGGDEGGAEGGE